MPGVYTLPLPKHTPDMKINLLITALAALIPMLLGFIWYHPKAMGNAWQKAAGLSDDQIKNANMPLIFGLSLLFALMLSVGLNPVVIHQFHLGSLMMNEPGFADKSGEAWNEYQRLLASYGNNFRSFGHGAVHGTIGGIFVVVPALMTNALFERKGLKYGLINSGYWILCLALMGGVICAFS